MKKEIYSIGGMRCASCSSAVERVTSKLDGVKSSEVNLLLNILTIEYDETKLSSKNIIRTIEKAGFTANLDQEKKNKKETYNIGGMRCAACSSAVERVTSKLNGVTSSEVNLPLNRLTVEYDNDQLSSKDIINSIEKAGFTANLQTTEKPKKAEPERKTKSVKEDKSRRNNLIVSIVLSIILLYISMGSMLIKNIALPEIIKIDSNPFNFALIQLLLTIPIIYSGKSFYTNGFKALFHKNPNMDSLVAISSLTSLLYSLGSMFLISRDPSHVHHLYFESAAVIITLVLLGKYLEDRSKKKTTGAITKLMELAPETAILIENEQEKEVNIEELKKGDIVLVKSGMRVPLDGVVTKGSGSSDESMLTGESLPVSKEIESEVIGGSIIVGGALYVRITKVGQETTLSKIIKFVEDAQGKKAPIAKIADKVAGVFVPIVISVALLSSILWIIVGNKDFSFGVRIFTSVLVIACPCAMGLATPTAIIVGTGLGASKGILIRSGVALETTHNVKAVVLDKTGTITTGKPSVSEIVTNNMKEDDLLALASSVEKLSDHPLAKAIVQEFESKGQKSNVKISKFKDFGGKGIVATTLDKVDIHIGSKKFIEENNIDTSTLEEKYVDLSSKGQTPVFVAYDNELCGIISISDSIKETSKEAIDTLRHMGIPSIILTGDNKRAADYICSLVGADEVYAEVLPEQKAEIVEKIKKDYGCVMMVGDGINDAPALTQADIGCAIGNGSDIAIESADIVLMKSDLKDVPKAINLSRYTIRNIKQNLFWAFCYNTLGIPVAAGLFYNAFNLLLTPMIGAFAMSLSSLFVVTNALSLRNKKI